MSSASRENDDTIRERIVRQANAALRKFSSPIRVPLTRSPAGSSQDADSVKFKKRFPHSQNNILCYGSSVPNVTQTSSPYISNTQQNDTGNSVNIINVNAIPGGQPTLENANQDSLVLEHCSRCTEKGVYLDGEFKRCLNCGMFSLTSSKRETTIIPETFYNKTAVMPSSEMIEETRSPSSNDQWKSAKESPMPVKSTPRRRRAKQKPKEKVCLTISSDEEDGGKHVSQTHSSDEKSEKVESENRKGSSNIDSDCPDSPNVPPKYKIPKMSERMKPQGGKMTADNSQEYDQPNGYASRPLLSLCSFEKQFELPVKSIHLGSLPGRCITPLSLQNNTLKVEVECTYEVTEGNTKKVMNEKYKLALSSVEVAQINLNFEKDPFMISVIPSKRYSEIVNQALSRCILDVQNEDPIKRQIVFFIECEQSLFKRLLEKNLQPLQRIAKVCAFSDQDCEQLVACVKQSQMPSKVHRTRSATAQTAKTVRNVRTMFVYPLPPQKGGIAITNADVECLMPGIYLNDTIIDFYLKYIYEEKLDKMQKQKTYIFNSYFYTRLSKKAFLASNDIQNPEERMHAQVRKWTRDVNLFEKDFIIIPINEHSHWFLVIICFPSEVKVDEESTANSSNVSAVNEEDVQVENQAKERNVKDMEEQMEVDQETISISETEKSSTEGKDENSKGYESKESVPEPKDCSTGSKDDASAIKERTDKEEDKNVDDNKEDPSSFKQPCILIFDSLVSGGRSRVFSNLRHYLTLEWKEKVGGTESSKVFTKNNIKGSFPKIPRQSNDCDCGIYILQFAECFFESPIVNYKFPIKKETWFTKSHVDGKRESIKGLIFDMERQFLEGKTNEGSKG